MADLKDKMAGTTKMIQKLDAEEEMNKDTGTAERDEEIEQLK